MVKNIVFDFNGTIVDDLDVSIDALNACILKFLPERKFVSKEEYLEIFRFPVGPLYEELGFNFDTLDYNVLADYFISYYESRAFNECKLFDDIIELLKELKTRGYKLYILSVSYIELLRNQLKKYGIAEFFDGVIAQDNKHGGSKVEKAKVFFKENNLNPKESIMIGDTLHDIEVAHEIGMECISYDRGHNSRRLLSTKNDKVIHQYKELLNYL